MLGGERYEMLALGEKHRIARDENSARLLLHGGGESGIKFGVLCSLDDKGSSSRGAGGILQIFEIDLRVSVVWILDEESKQLDTWQQFGRAPRIAWRQAGS